jgi:hypothetical protein
MLIIHEIIKQPVWGNRVTTDMPIILGIIHVLSDFIIRYKLCYTITETTPPTNTILEKLKTMYNIQNKLHLL